MKTLRLLSILCILLVGSVKTWSLPKILEVNNDTAKTISGVTINQNLQMTVGGTITVNPVEVVKKTYTDYSCSGTVLRQTYNYAAINITIDSKHDTWYPTPNQTVGQTKGSYETYKVNALKSGTYEFEVHVKIVKREVNKWIIWHYGDVFVKYVIAVSDIPVVKSITIPSNLTLSIGDSYTFSPVIYEQNAQTSLSWTSSNPSVVPVNNGTITALGIGNATISCVADNGINANCFVTVNPVYVNNISLNRSVLDIEESSEFKLEATISPENATNKSVEWKSSNDNVAFVISDGTVIGLSEGTCYIIVKAKDGSDANAYCRVNVIKDTSDIDAAIMNKDNYIIYNLTGTRKHRLQKGLNIINSADGRFIKVLKR